MITFKSSAPAFLRIGLSLIILWFGSQQLMHVSAWVGYLPSWIDALPIRSEHIVYANGLFEVVFGLFMLAGFYTRFVAFFLALHMLEIAHVVFGQGLVEIAVRDLGLAFAVISIYLHGADDFSVDTLWQR